MESIGMSRSFWAGKRVFITGHTGFKGGWLALWLADMQAEVKRRDRTSRAVAGADDADKQGRNYCTREDSRWPLGKRSKGSWAAWLWAVPRSVRLGWQT